MIGNNFFVQNSPDYNPLLDQSLAPGKKEEPSMEESNICPVVHLFEELDKLDLPPEEYFAHLLKGLSGYHFFIMNPQCKARSKDEELIQQADHSEELEIEEIDIQRNPEQVAKAVEEKSFVFLKQPEGEEPLQMKVAPKWERRIKAKKIQQIRIKRHHEHGESCKVVKGCHIQVTAFTVEEIDKISTVLFKAVDIAYQIRNLEQQKKEAEEKKKKDQEEFKSGEKQFRESLVKGQFKGRSEQAVQAKKSVTMAFNAASKAAQDRFIEKQRFSARQEEAKRQEQLEEKDEKQARIIKKEIQDCELKREIKLREIKQTDL
jgi:hypothetical protein